ncbi:MAG TPA: peptidylprolyl isomerase [Polyangia bacterium]|jgi:hypothetical protein
MTTGPPQTPRSRLSRLLHEPLVHFFALGLLLFFAHRLFVGAPRTVVVTPQVKAELSRLYQEMNGRPPSAAELATEVRKWEVDEALSREALRDHLDRDDPGIRTILADKMRLRAAFEAPKREPTDAEQDAWLAAHRSLYATAPLYDFEFVTFPRSDPRAQAAREEFERALAQGKDAASLGRPVIGGNLSAEDLLGMKDRVEPELAARIPGLAPGSWQRVETTRSLVLARVKGVGGGMPTRQQLGARLVADWKRITQQEAVDALLERTVLERYRFEEQP